MRSFILVGAIVGLAAASPAPQFPNIADIAAAPSPTATGPALAANVETSVYVQATAESAASAEVSTIASAAATTTVAAKRRRGDDYEYNSYSKSSSTKSSSTAKTTSSTSSSSTKTSSSSSYAGYGSKSSSSSTTRSSTVSSSSSASSSAAPSPSTTPSTILQQASTTTTSSDTSCPTVPEAGTYCGFINPEDPCAPQPDGYGPQVRPDTVDAFMSYAPFHQMAQDAKTPTGYVNTFRDLNASCSANTYLGLHTLSSYDTLGCSQWCDNTTLCTAFNIYVERDPSLNPTKPDATTDASCPNPSSITNYKCTLWGSGVDAASANNFGGWRLDFQVVITGSNGYAKTNNTTPPSQPGWSEPTSCHGGAIDRPSCFIGSDFFPGPYDPSVCASYAKSQTSYNKKHADSKGRYSPCNMFNAYMVKKNGKPLGTYCSLYNEDMDTGKYASFKGAWSGKDYYGLESSWTYTLQKQLAGDVEKDGKDD